MCLFIDHYFPVDGDSEAENGLLFLSASQDQNIHLWRVSTTSESTNNTDDNNDDVINTGSTSSADSAKLLHQFKGHAQSVEALAVSPNKQEVCVCVCVCV